jgi:protein ImuA
MTLRKANIIADLQADILRLQGFERNVENPMDVGLGPIQQSFPNASFPRGSVHEFLTSAENSAPTSGFIAGLLSSLMGKNGAVVWISRERPLFPPALKIFGLQPDRIIFINLRQEKEVGWALDEALKCGALSAVVGEVQEISFNATRRLQLAVEQSQVTGFVLRKDSTHQKTSACVSRWRIISLPSISKSEEKHLDFPGIGFPTWRVELLRIKNGKPGVWDIRWIAGKFEVMSRQEIPVLKSSQRNSA